MFLAGEGLACLSAWMVALPGIMFAKDLAGVNDVAIFNRNILENL